MLWQPAPIIVGHPTLFTGSEIELFEKHILNNPEATERDASTFFTQHPKFLFLGTGAEIRREVVLYTDSGTTTRRVDFFRRSYGEAFWDIIELKGPTKPSFVSPVDGHPRPSSFLVQAISQAEDYRDMIIADEALRARLCRIGIAVCHPQILIVVGQQNTELDPKALAVLNDRIRRGPVEARTYTDIYNFAKEHFACRSLILVGTFNCELQRVHSLPAISSDTIIANRKDASVLSFGPTFSSLLQDDWTSTAQSLSSITAEIPSRLLVLDLSHVEFVSSAFLGAILMMGKSLADRGGHMCLANVDQTIRKVLEITRLSKLFVIGKTVDDAILSVRSNS